MSKTFSNSLFVIIYILAFTANSRCTTPIDSVEVLIREDKFLEAVPILTRLAKKDTTNFDNYYYLGKCYQNLSDHSRACYYFQQGLRIDPLNQRCLSSLGASYTKVKLYDQAIQQYLKLLQLDKNNTSAKLQLGKIYIKQDNYFAASNIFRELSEIPVLHNVALVNLGFCAFQVENYSRAINYLKEAYKNDPDNFRTLYLLIRSYYKSGNYKYALVLAERGLKVYPDQTFLLHSKATILFNLKLFKKAIPVYTKLIELKNNPDFQDYQKLGICYYYENKLKLADLKLRESYKKDSSNALTSYYLGVTNLELNNFESASKYLEKTINLSAPSFLGDTYFYLASVNSREQNFSEAIANYKRALQFSPESPEIYYYLASLYDKHLGLKDTALIYYRKYVNSPGKKDKIDVMGNYAELRIQQIIENAFLHDKEKFNEMTSE